MLHSLRLGICATALATALALGGSTAEPGTTTTEARAYVVLETDTTGAALGEVKVIDTSTNAVVATIPVGFRPGVVVVAPDGKRAYVTNRIGPGGTSGGASVDSSISVIDTATNTVVSTIVSSSLFPQAIDIMPDGSRLYVGNAGSANVSVIDTTTQAVLATIPVGVEPFGLKLTPDGSRAFVSNFRSNNVSVIDTTTNSVIATVGTGAGPNQIDITPDGVYAYVANSFSNTVSVIAVATNTVVATISVGSLPDGVAVTPSGDYVYVTNATSTSSPGSVSVIATATNSVVATIAAGTFPIQVDVSPDGTRAYVSNNHSANVTVIDTSTNTVCATLSVGLLPFGLRVAEISTNEAPIADAGPDQSIHAGDAVQLDGSGSLDDNTAGADLEYAWTLSVPTGSGASLDDDSIVDPTFTADVVGTYVATLVVTDEEGASSPADEVVISSSNLAPTADAGMDVVSAVDLEVTISGSATDPEGDALTYAWTLTSFPVGSGAALSDADTATPSLTPDEIGDYVLTLVASDPYDDSPPATMTLTVVSGSDYAESRMQDASDAIAVLDDADFAKSGHREQFAMKIGGVTKDLQKGKTDGAIKKLEKLLERTDGCVLRGTPDTHGAGKDWIVDCDAQEELYAILSAALEALQA